MELILIIFIFLIGICFGSFFNVLIDRLPHEQSIQGRSHCDHCKRTLDGRDLIPIFSFLFLGGKCRTCKKNLSFQYPLVEFLTGMTFVLTAFYVKYAVVIPGSFGTNWGTTFAFVTVLLHLIIVSTLIVIFVTDLKYQIIPDQMQIVLLVASVALALVTEGFRLSPLFLLYELLAGLSVMAPILLIYVFTRGRGMGFGDVKYAFNMGILLGVQGGMLALYIAFVTGALGGVALVFFGRTKLKSKIAFGPFLILGSIVMLFFREQTYEIIARLYSL